MMSEGQEEPITMVDLLMAPEVAAAAEALATDTADPSVDAQCWVMLELW